MHTSNQPTTALFLMKNQVAFKHWSHFWDTLYRVKDNEMIHLGPISSPALIMTIAHSSNGPRYQWPITLKSKWGSNQSPLPPSRLAGWDELVNFSIKGLFWLSCYNSMYLSRNTVMWMPDSVSCWALRASYSHSDKMSVTRGAHCVAF